MANSKKVRLILLRTLSVFIASGLSVVIAAAALGREIWKSSLVTGLLGVVMVVRGLLQAYLQDGKLTYKEIDEVFDSVDTTPSNDTKTD